MQGCDFGGSPVQGQEQDWMVPVGLFHDSLVLLPRWHRTPRPVPVSCTPPSTATVLEWREQCIRIYCLLLSKHLIKQSRNLPFQLLFKKEVGAHKAEEETHEALWFLAQEQQGP